MNVMSGGLREGIICIYNLKKKNEQKRRVGWFSGRWMKDR